MSAPWRSFHSVSGIAGNATVFSLVQAPEFPHLIYPDARRIVFLESKNGDPAVVGSAIRLDGVTTTVVGVLAVRGA